VAADRHEQMIPQRTMQPPIAHVREQLTPIRGLQLADIMSKQIKVMAKDSTLKSPLLQVKDHYLKLITHWPVSGAGNRRQLSGAKNFETLCQQMIPTEKKQRMIPIFENFEEDDVIAAVFFVLFCELKNV